MLLNSVMKHSAKRHVIQAERLTRYYGSRVGVSNIDLEIPPGQVFGFLGPNGAGKTTTIRLLLGFLRPSSGRATIMSRDCWNERARICQQVGYLPGDVRLYPWFTARRALRISGLIRHRRLWQFGHELCERFSLEPTLPVRKMSRGMRQKLGLILTLAHKPQVLILDEPTSGLDPLVQDELLRLLKSLAHEGHTIFFSSHTLHEVEQLCDQIAIVNKGQIVANESLASLRKQASRSVTIVFSAASIAQSIEPPSVLRVESRLGAQWDCELIGSPQPLIAWAAAQPLADLTIGPANLELVFRRFYHSPGKDL